MRFLRPASRALSHLLRHEPVHHHPAASLFARNSPFAPLARAFNDPFFSSPFAHLYTVYEHDDTHSSNKAAQQQQQQAKQEEAKAAEPQTNHQQQQQQQARSSEGRVARHEDGHRQRWLDRRHRGRHAHRHSHHPLSLFSPFDSLLAAHASHYQPLDITLDLFSTPAAYQVHAAIPGVKKEDIKLTVDDGVLTIEAERREERGRPAKAQPQPAASNSADAAPTAEAAQGEQQKAEQVEVKAADNTTTSAQPTTTQQQQQTHTTAATEAAAAEEQDEDDVAVHHVESYYGRVQRSVQLPDDVDVDGLSARYEDGVLRIELPRVEERRQQAKQINIQ